MDSSVEDHFRLNGRSSLYLSFKMNTLRSEYFMLVTMYCHIYMGHMAICLINLPIVFSVRDNFSRQKGNSLFLTIKIDHVILLSSN